VCTWIESKLTSAAIVAIGRVNILEILPLVVKRASVYETCTVLKPSYIASEHAGSAPLKATHEYILVVAFIPVLHIL
jgi:hypothetical protein